MTAPGPLPCYEAIEEHQLLESLYSFQQQRQHQDGEGQQQGGQKVRSALSGIRDGWNNRLCPPSVN